MASNLRATWAEGRAREAEKAEEELRRSRAEVGAAHREADNFTQALFSVSSKDVASAWNDVAVQRGDKALQKIAEERRKVKDEEDKRREFRQKALAREQERAKRIASLPPPGNKYFLVLSIYLPFIRPIHLHRLHFLPLFPPHFLSHLFLPLLLPRSFILPVSFLLSFLFLCLSSPFPRLD